MFSLTTGVVNLKHVGPTRDVLSHTPRSTHVQPAVNAALLLQHHCPTSSRTMAVASLKPADLIVGVLIHTRLSAPAQVLASDVSRLQRLYQMWFHTLDAVSSKRVARIADAL